jgi:hypothetical protein
MRRPSARKCINRPDRAGIDRTELDVRADPNSVGFRRLPHTHTHRGRNAVRRSVCNCGLAGRPEGGKLARRGRRALAAGGARLLPLCSALGEGGRALRGRPPPPTPRRPRRRVFAAAPGRRGEGGRGRRATAAAAARPDGPTGRRKSAGTAAASPRPRFPDVRRDAGQHLATYTRDGPQRRGRSTRRQQRRGRRVAAKCRPASSPVRCGGASAPAGRHLVKCVENRPSVIVENPPWPASRDRGNGEEIGRS